MEVDLRAVSDALDGILAAGQNSAPRHAASAIIQRRPVPPAATMSVTAAPPQPPRPTAAPKITSLPTAPRSTTTTHHQSPIGLTAEKTPSGAAEKRRSQPSRQPAAQETDDQALFIRSAARGSQSSLPSASRERPASKSPSPGRGSTSAGLADLFDLLRHGELVAVKIVEATGLGSAAALLTPQNVGRRMEKGLVSAKSWVTNTSLAPQAVALFALESPDGVQRRRKARHIANGTSVKDAVCPLEIQNLALVVLLERSSKHAPDDEVPLYAVAVETSASKHEGFVTSASAVVVAGAATSITIPGTLVNRYLRILITPSGDGLNANLVRVRAMCILRAESWTVENTPAAPQPRHMSLKEEVELVLREDSVREARTATPLQDAAPADPISPVAANKSVTAFSDRAAPTNEVQGYSGVDVAPLPSSPYREAGGADVAAYVKNLVLAQAGCQAGGVAAQTATPVPEFEYDWLADEFVAAATAERKSHSRYLDAAAEGFEKSTSTSSGAALNEYVATLQAWNLAPTLTCDAGLSYCLSAVTAFSVSTLTETALFGDEGGEQLAQPFKFQLCVVSRERSAAPAAFLPPVHALSAIANHASNLGCSVELTFTCTEFSGFGCALRPRRETTQPQEERVRLLMVVFSPPGEAAGPGGRGAQTAYEMLQRALSIFRRSADGGRAALPMCGVTAPKPCGALRLVLDGTCCFDVLAPVLAQWTQTSGSFRYYGSARQPTLHMLFWPLSVADRDGEMKVPARSDARWSSLRLCFSGAWKGEAQGESGEADTVVALEVAQDQPATFVWQPPQSGLRLVVTEAHIAGCVPLVDGVVAPSPEVKLLRGYFSALRESAAGPIPPFVTLSEGPWQELLEAAARFCSDFAVSSAATATEEAAAFFALRRQVTVAYAFYILSTAFKRGWARVGAGVPLCNGQLRLIADKLQRHFTALESEASATETGKTERAVVMLDEDAFMDTLLHWSYPCPTVVVLHCTDVVHADTAHFRASSHPLDARTFFSEATLARFTAVATPTVAIS